MIKKNKAFTLIELLMVVSIISLLSSIVVVSLNESRQKARDVAKIQTINEIRKALDLFVTAKGYYPSTEDLIDSLTKGSVVYIKEIDSKIIYKGLNLNKTECSAVGTKCPSYHMSVVLERTDNPALKIDSDTTNVFPGKSSNCKDPVPNTDYCYDIEPSI